MVMKLYLKMIPGIVGLTGICLVIPPVDAQTPYSTYTTNVPARLNYSGPRSIATSSSNSVVVALNAQALLLKDLIQDHQKRAADLTQKSQGEKAKWETDLVNELQEKNIQLQKNIDQASQVSPATSSLKPAADVDDQLVFVSTVEAGLERIRQELSAVIEDTRLLTMQLGTNKAPEDVASMSLVLGENQRLVKELQREELDLVLRKLEFQAISKLLQK